MRPPLNSKAILAIALVLGSELVGIGRCAAASSPDTSSTITVQINNYANVDSKTLNEAEEAAARILGEVGVEIRWVDVDVALKAGCEDSAASDTFNLSHIQLSIYPREMAERLSVPGNALGLAPGNGADRQLVYIFYNRVEALHQRQLGQRTIGSVTSKPVILGHAIAHELGHVLGIEVHSLNGIMRGCWNEKDLMDMRYGMLNFTSHQGEIIRAEAVRRNLSRHEPLEGARIQFSVEAMPN